jgi:hypothetical protein
MNFILTLFPSPISSSDPEETPNSLDGEIGVFASLIPVLTISLIGLIFDQKGVLFAVFLQVAYHFYSKGT